VNTYYNIKWRVDFSDKRKEYGVRFICLLSRGNGRLRALWSRGDGNYGQEGMEEIKHYCHKGLEDIKYYCHKGMETIVKRAYYLFPIFPYGEKPYGNKDNRGNEKK